MQLPTRSLLATVVALAALAPLGAQEPTLTGLTFYPVQPCRILDTRPGSGVQGAGAGPLAAGVPYAFEVSGEEAACGVPAEARAVALDLIAVAPTAAGHLTLWPWDAPAAPPPTASLLNFEAGTTIANAATVRICHPSAANASCVDDLFAVFGGGAAHLVVDVLGYYAPPGFGQLWGEGRPDTTIHGPGSPRPDSLCVNGDFEFGLSLRLATWGDAASACPAGTWVCTWAQRGGAACDTDRASTSDLIACDGNSNQRPDDDNLGWLADPLGDHHGMWMRELGAVNDPGIPYASPTCTRLPVWCCSTR